MREKKNILGVGISNATRQEILEYIWEVVKNRSQKLKIFTPNPEMIVAAANDSELKHMLNEADISLCDGAGLYSAARFLKQPLKERITGVDLMENLCKESVRKGASIGLLGAGAGVAEKTAECLRKKYPGIKIVFVTDELRDSEGKDLQFTNKDNAKHIDILFVAFGFPKQERWIIEHIEKLPITVAMGVGGAFDYISGTVPRAPKLVRSLGMEWLYRLIHQPWRWRRQLALVEFVYLVSRALLIRNNK